MRINKDKEIENLIFYFLNNKEVELICIPKLPEEDEEIIVLSNIEISHCMQKNILKVSLTSDCNNGYKISNNSISKIEEMLYSKIDSIKEGIMLDICDVIINKNLI